MDPDFGWVLTSWSRDQDEDHKMLFRYRRRFEIEVDPLIDHMIDKSKLEESEKKMNDFQKQVSDFMIFEIIF